MTNTYGQYGYLYSYSPSHTMLVVTNVRIANKINRLLGMYEGRIKTGDEVQFLVDNGQVVKYSKLLGIRTITKEIINGST